MSARSRSVTPLLIERMRRISLPVTAPNVWAAIQQARASSGKAEEIA